MKQILLIVLALLLTTLCMAQQQKAKVTLKNGTVLTGPVSELNPTSHIKLLVGGFETIINMDDIESIENVAEYRDAEQEPISEVAEVFDYDGLPEEYNLQVGPYVIEMKLVNGTTFSMGYDGHGSLKMNSEPVHDVTLSSYYINARPLNKDVIGYIKKGKEEHGKPNSVYRPLSRRDAKEVADKIAEISGVPVDLITEAQWEYAAVNINGIFDTTESEWNFCLDWYGNYSSSKAVQVDPVGPISGKGYVIRMYENDPRTVYYRTSTSYSDFSLHYAIRITFPAKSIK